MCVQRKGSEEDRCRQGCVCAHVDTAMNKSFAIIKTGMILQDGVMSCDGCLGNVMLRREASSRGGGWIPSAEQASSAIKALHEDITHKIRSYLASSSLFTYTSLHVDRPLVIGMEISFFFFH